MRKHTFALIGAGAKHAEGLCIGFVTDLRAEDRPFAANYLDDR